MSIGLPIDRQALDYATGATAQAIHTNLARAAQLKAWLDAHDTATLTAPPFGYTEGEVAALKSAFADLDQLRTVYEGTAAVAQAQDFRQFVRQVYGLGL